MADETTLTAADTDFAAEFAKLSEIPVPPVETPPAAAPGETPPAAAPAATPPAETPPAAAPAAAPAAPAETPPAAAQAETPPAAPDPAAEIARLTAELAVAKTAQTAAPAAPAAAAPAPPPAPEAPPLYSAAEKAVLDKYAAEWPDIAAGEALTRRAEHRDLVAFIFSEVRRFVEPIQAFVETRSTKDQYSEIKSLVSDYDDVRDKTLAWIDTQPAYLQAAYKEVTQSGAPEDVADLINRFKKETGYVAAPAAASAAAPASAPAVPAAPAKPTAAKVVAASLKVVPSSRTEAATPADANDFDSAFKEFSNAK